MIIGFVLVLVVISFLFQQVEGYELKSLLPNYQDFAAELIGIQLENIDDATFNIVHDALLRHKVLVVRNQKDFSIEGQRNFTKRLGHLHVHLESSSHLPGYQDVNVVSNIKNATTGKYIGLFGKHVENFHSDLSWFVSLPPILTSYTNPSLFSFRTDIPTKITILKSVIRPDQCGDTEYINTHAAYDHLPEDLKEQLTGKTASYCYLKLREIDNSGKAENLKQEEVEKANKCAIHPLFTTHPITGLRNVYANPSHTAFINGIPFEQSEELLQRLFQHSAQPQFIYRHVYQDDDVVLWDNRGKHKSPTYYLYLPFLTTLCH